MLAWRIYPHQAPYARAADFNPLDGAGGRVAASRWNDAGHPVIYAAENASLAALETLAQLRSPAQFGERTIVQFQVGGSMEEVSFEQLLRLREDAPPDDPESLTRQFGTAWLKEQRSLALSVPSFVMPYDRNILVNPLHPDAAAIRLLKSERLRLDARLLR